MYAASLAIPFSSCPTPAVRNKRARKAVEKWDLLLRPRSVTRRSEKWWE
jgi:hypothetical protein